MSQIVQHTDAETGGEGRETVDSVVVRFAGDSGDGVQLTGSLFTLAAALAGNDLATFPDFPAEIRAPVGTTFGVSAYQINFGTRHILTHGDWADVLVAMNPAALKVNLENLREGGLLIIDSGAFVERNLRKAGYETDPRADGSLSGYRVVEIDVSKQTLAAVESFDLGKKAALRSKNMWLLGLVYWMYDRERAPVIERLKRRFAKKQTVAEANIAALNAGHAFGETMEIQDGAHGYRVPAVKSAPGLYRNVTGAEGIAWGLVAGADLAGLPLFFGSYPITPASTVLHTLAPLKQLGVTTFQAEDEIAAVCAAIGASYAGSLGTTASSGPGLALKTEAIGLAIGAELPLVIVDVQRAGPSTGMPTKTEQSDLLQAVYGRNGDSPLAVLATRSPADCFDTTIEACRLAVTYMTPVIVLSDGYIANAAEPAQIPEMSERERFPVRFRTDPEGFHPFLRDDDTLARVWAVPGTPGLQHRIGSIERNFASGHISYDPGNHQRMTDTRKAKMARIADDIPAQVVEDGAPGAALCVIGWGSTYGAIARAVANLRGGGGDVAHVHLRHIHPFPANLGELLGSFGKVVVAEMNSGQLSTVLRAEYLLPAVPVTKVQGQPFKIAEIEAALAAHLEA